ncbi:rRNA maturation RNase YbeY [Lachnospiraceae bacterium NSJ-143]|nr:rRNA maturation RNase YbeY [Lachnospiraceae bacterium NSJ-143]
MTVLIDNRSDFDLTEEYRKLFNDVVAESLSYEEFDTKSEISISIVDNNEIQEINRQYREIDAPTDVLSFPLLTFEEGEQADVNENDEILLGDIIISIDKAREQAQEYGHGLRRELAFLTAHSMLHLLGYDHIDEQEQKDMFERQERILENLGIRR